METVSMTRRFDADAESVRECVTDLEPFMKAAGFDEVTESDSILHIENSVGLATINLELEVYDRPGSTLAYRQREGIFKEMTTWYELIETADGVELSATTEFELDVALVGMILDATVIKRQRRKELAAQFDYLAKELDGNTS